MECCFIPDHCRQSFYSTACEQVSELYEPFREMVNAYRNVCCVFGENHRIIEPAELFGHLIDFISAFKVCTTKSNLGYGRVLAT